MNPNPPQLVHITENARLENLNELLEDYLDESTWHATTRGDGVSPELEEDEDVWGLRIIYRGAAE